MLQAARKRLEDRDIARLQIDELERTRQVKKYLTLTSPVNGIIIKAGHKPGHDGAAGDAAYGSGNVSTVWVDAESTNTSFPGLGSANMP